MRLGILGSGNFTAKVNSFVQDKTSFTVAGVYDGKPVEGLQLYTSLPQFIAEVDAVAVLDFLAADMGIYTELVKNGKHLYIESPALLTRSELRKIDALSQEAGTIIQVGLKQRFYNFYSDLEKYQLFPRIIESSRLVKFDKKSTHLSAIDDLMLHDIDVTLKLANCEVKSISATAVGIYYKDPDVVNTRIEFYNGCVANLSASKIGVRNKHKANFFQNTSFCTIDFMNQQLEVQNNAADQKAPTESWGVKTTYRQSKDSDGYLSILSKEFNAFYTSIAENLEGEAAISQYLQLKSVTDKIKEQLERNFITNA